MYSHPIVIIFKQIYLTHRFGGNELLYNSPELEPHHQMQFSIIPKTPGGESYLSPGNTIKKIYKVYNIKKDFFMVSIC